MQSFKFVELLRCIVLLTGNGSVCNGGAVNLWWRNNLEEKNFKIELDLKYFHYLNQPGTCTAFLIFLIGTSLFLPFDLKIEF